MACYPQNTTGLNYITYTAGPTVNGALATGAAGANTKGSYVEVAASTAFESNRSVIAAQATNSGGVRHLLDIATGAAASESVIIPDILIEGAMNTSESAAAGYPFPCAIAASTRIAARSQGSTGSTGVRIAITLMAAGGVPGIATFTNYGSNTGDSGGVTVDPGGTANTKGAYAQITASTSAVVQWLIVMFGYGGNTAPNNSRWAVDVATGAAASEVVLIPDLRTSGHPANAAHPACYELMTYIAASTRIACRSSCSINDATDRLLDIALLTATAPAEAAAGGTSAYASFG
jgi:hypothetical protein